MHEDHRKKTSAGHSMVSLAQFSHLDLYDLERTFDLLGQRRLQNSSSTKNFFSFFPGWFLQNIEHPVPFSRRHELAFYVYVAFLYQRLAVCHVHYYFRAMALLIAQSSFF